MKVTKRDGKYLAGAIIVGLATGPIGALAVGIPYLIGKKEDPERQEEVKEEEVDEQE